MHELKTQPIFFYLVKGPLPWTIAKVKQFGKIYKKLERMIVRFVKLISFSDKPKNDE